MEKNLEKIFWKKEKLVKENGEEVKSKKIGGVRYLSIFFALFPDNLPISLETGKTKFLSGRYKTKVFPKKDEARIFSNFIEKMGKQEKLYQEINAYSIGRGMNHPDIPFVSFYKI